MTSSPLFWVVAFVLLAGTLAILILPLVRRNAGAVGDEAAVTAVYRDHKRQIDADYAAGTITDAERDAALDELARRFSQELGVADATRQPAGDRPRLIAAVVVAATLPVVAGTLYFVLGNPTAMTATPSVAAAGATDQQVVEMVEGLARRLQATPEDGEGWALLARSYRVLGRFEPAAQAYAEAAKRLPESAALYTDWAEAIGQMQNRSLAGQPTDLLRRALKLDPDYPKALALAGAAAMEHNDTATALAMWKRLRAGLPADSPDVQQVDAIIARLERGAPTAAPSAALPPATTPAPSPSASAAPAAKSGSPGAAAGGSPSAGAGGAASTTPTATSADQVAGRVELDPKLAARASPGDTVFIFARDPSGPRMPLAAMKITVAELPKAFVLTDAMAMSEQHAISKAKSVVIEARVSKSGGVTQQPGDLSGVSDVVTPGARDVRVTIDRVVP